MARLHHCEDGMPVTDKVLLYQVTREAEHYLPVHRYYDNFRDKWYVELRDFLDRSTFDAEYDYKLVRAIDSFDGVQAKDLCEKYKYSFVGAFNRWFYAVLRNWKSNVKTSAFRQKKRPSVQCPICGRKVPKIDEQHLAHYKTKSDLPKAFSWKGNVYSTTTTPDAYVNCWGKYNRRKLNDINMGNTKPYKKERIEWIWFMKDGRRGVVCPFSKKIIEALDNDYIMTLPKRHNRYARPFTWQEFVEEFPHPILIQAEIYSLDYNAADDDAALSNNISVAESIEELTHEDIEQKNISSEYEHVFYLIESMIADESDQKIAKLVAVGYSDADIASVLEIDKKEVRQRKKEIRSHSKELKDKLLDSV